MTSVYDTDPRVSDMGGLWEIHGFGRMFGSVVRTGSGYDAYPDDGRTQQTFATRDEAFEYVAGPPMEAPAPGAGLRELESIR